MLVLGAGGGIGLAAIDVARHLGARVIAAASSEEKLAAARAAGAEATIAYETEDLKVRARELSGGGVDVVVDPVGDRFADPALRALGWMGRYLVIGFAGGEIPRLPVNQVLLNNRTLVGVDWGAWTMRDPAGNQALLARAHGPGRVGRPPPGGAPRVPARRRRRRAHRPAGPEGGRQGRPRALIRGPGALTHHRCRCSSSVTKAKRSCS